MPRTSTRLLALGAALAAVGAAGPATARQSVLFESEGALRSALAAGLGPDDMLYQARSDAPVLPAARRWATIDGSELLPLSAGEMAARLREAIISAPGHAVVIDDLGPDWEGAPATTLAAALGELGKSGAAHVRGPLARRVHIFVAPDAGRVLTGAGFAGIRATMGRVGGAWLKTTGWTPADWLTWPAETVRMLRTRGLGSARAHLLFTPGDQSAAWSLARTGSACTLLSSGPGTYGLGDAVPAWAAEFRRAFPRWQKEASGCVGAPALPAAAASALAAAAAAEGTGIAIAPGGLVTPPLVAGAPAQVTLQLGPDPLGLAAGLGRTPEAVWTALGAVVQVRGPGVALDVPVGGDSSAPIAFTPSAPGPVTMTLVIRAAGIGRALGGTGDLVDALAAAPGGDALLPRIVADPDGWTLALALRPSGGAPGDPALTVVPAP